MSKKQDNQILSLGKNKENNIIEKSLPLLDLWKQELTLPEYKIMDIYLSRINSHNQENDEVIISKKELEEILGVTQIKVKELNKRLINLQKTVIPLIDHENGDPINVTLFEISRIRKNDDDVNYITLKCTESSKKYIFNIDNIGYIKYRLKAILKIDSKKTYNMYLYIIKNRFREVWEIEVDELRKMLNCEGSSYDEWKEFNRKLNKINDYINENTDIKYEYEGIRVGRKTKKVKFKYISQVKEEIAQNIEENSEITKTAIEKLRESPDTFPLWVSALENLEKVTGYTFSEEEIDELNSLIITVPVELLPMPNFLGVEYDMINFMYYHYIEQKVAYILRINKMKKIKNVYRYMVTMIKNDIY